MKNLVRFPNREKQEKREARLIVIALSMGLVAHFIMSYYGW